MSLYINSICAAAGENFHTVAKTTQIQHIYSN